MLTTQTRVTRGYIYRYIHVRIVKACWPAFPFPLAFTERLSQLLDPGFLSLGKQTANMTNLFRSKVNIFQVFFFFIKNSSNSASSTCISKKYTYIKTLYTLFKFWLAKKGEILIEICLPNLSSATTVQVSLI